MKLYEISDAYLQLLEADEVDVTAELDSLNIAFAEKAENIVKLIRSLNAQGSAIKDEIKKLRDKLGAVEGRVDGLKHYLQTGMEKTGKDSLDVGIFRVRLQNSPLSVKIIDVGSLPEQFKREIVEIRVDKRGIIDHIKSTGEVPVGIQAVQGRHIRIY